MLLDKLISRTFLVQRRNLSILTALRSSPVLISADKDVYTNLALEQWLYTNLRFTKKDDETITDNKTFKHPIVLIWTDEPSIVIGRHQNPWIESNLRSLGNAGVKLARRHSGGGCVYHDENNINISIIGDRKSFDQRQNNLIFLAKVLQQKYGIKCQPTERHDLIHSDTGLKVSGSAAKLGQTNSYHHFTLLVDTNKELLYSMIRKEPPVFITTNSSSSHRSEVINLKDIKKDLDVNQVISSLANEYKKLYLGAKVIQSDLQSKSPIEEENLHELGTIKEELKSWDWIYGRTPKFKIRKSFPLIQDKMEKNVTFHLKVDKGLFEHIEVETDLVSDFPLDKFDYLIGTRFTYLDAMINITKSLQGDEDVLSLSTEQLFTAFLLQIIQETNP